MTHIEVLICWVLTIHWCATFVHFSCMWDMATARVWLEATKTKHKNDFSASGCCKSKYLVNITLHAHHLKVCYEFCIYGFQFILHHAPELGPWSWRFPIQNCFLVQCGFERGTDGRWRNAAISAVDIIAGAKRLYFGDLKFSQRRFLLERR